MQTALDARLLTEGARSGIRAEPACHLPSHGNVGLAAYPVRAKPAAILGENCIGTPRPELGEYINALSFERHIIYFLTYIIIIRILKASHHLN